VADSQKTEWSRPAVRDFDNLDEALAYYSKRLTPEDLEKLESLFRAAGLVRPKRAANG
jgi:hypothetical protein